MRLSAAERRAKLAKLIAIEGYESIEELAQAILSDSVSPAICMNEDCDFTSEMELSNRILLAAGRRAVSA
jgi:hypothetical protein